MFSARILAGANAAARARDHVLMIGETDGDAGVTTDLVHEFVDRQVDGLLFVTRTTSRISLPKGLEGTRVVTVNCVDDSAPYPSVLPDDRGGGRRAAEAILDIGRERRHRRGGRGADAGGAGRCADRRAHRATGRGRHERLGVAGVSPGRSTPRTTSWRRGLPPADVLGWWCASTTGSPGASTTRWPTSRWPCPRDVSVISFDGSELGRWMRPTLASVALPFFEMGEEAVRILLDPSENESVVMEMPLLAGDSLTTSARV